MDKTFRVERQSVVRRYASIAPRLTDADTGEQIWSENYTRDQKDVFAVQTELAETIIGKLRGQLTGGTARVNSPGVAAGGKAAAGPNLILSSGEAELKGTPDKMMKTEL